MLSAELNERLTRVGPGTPMGNLLRRYWMPIAASSELGRFPLRRRLLGEDLVLFRGVHGELGLFDERCPHRHASLAYACIEEQGLRCAYHGWLFDMSGHCVEQPAEPKGSTFKDRVSATAYKAQELGGLIFAYLGPEPAPLLPRFDLFVADGVWRDIGNAMLPVNWLQIMENSVDTHHADWLHRVYHNYLMDVIGDEQNKKRLLRSVEIGFDPFEYGIIKRRVVEGRTREDEDWKIGHPLVFPIMVRVGGGGFSQFQIRVPVDDTHTWHVFYSCFGPVDGRVFPAQKDVPYYQVPFQDENGNFIVDYQDGQDMMAWITPGPIFDRTTERLGKSDIGVIMLRRVLQQQIRGIENGEDPIGTVRDPAVNNVPGGILLPQETNKHGHGGEFRTDSILRGSVRYSPNRDALLELYTARDSAATG